MKRAAATRTSERLGRAKALQIGSYTINNPITLFSTDTAGAFADRSLTGNIGAQIANWFRTLLDYRRRRIRPKSVYKFRTAKCVDGGKCHPARRDPDHALRRLVVRPSRRSRRRGACWRRLVGTLVLFSPVWLVYLGGRWLGWFSGTAASRSTAL